MFTSLDFTSDHVVHAAKDTREGLRKQSDVLENSVQNGASASPSIERVTNLVHRLLRVDTDCVKALHLGGTMETLYSGKGCI